LRDQAFGLGSANLRIALVIGEDQLDLGALEAGQTAALGKRQIGNAFGAVVDDIGGQLQRVSFQRRKKRRRPTADRSRRF
jgi:hypothetical protein